MTPRRLPHESLRKAIAHARALVRIADREPHSHQAVGEKEDVITVSAVCFIHRIHPGPGLPEGDWRVLGVRKRGTKAFMQPGGKPEAGETPLECAVREIKEELGLTLNPETLVSLGHARTRAANEANTRLEADLFLAPVVHNPGDFEVRAEIEELRWFSLQDLDERGAEDAVIAPLFAEVVVPQLRERLSG